MNIAFDDQNAFAGGASPGNRDFSHGLEWVDLRARLDAAREIACLFATEACKPRDRAAGSFARTAARSLTAYATNDHAVNPNASANGKRAGAMDADVVGHSRTDDRGQP